MRGRTSIGYLAMGLVLLSGCGAASRAPGGSDPAGSLVPGSLSHLREVVERTEPLLDRVPDEERQGTVILQRTIELNCGRYEFQRAESQSLYVYDRDDSTDFVQDLEIGGAQLRTAEAWRARADGSTEWFDRTAFAVHESGSGRRVVRLRLREPRTGDLIGWTIATRDGQGMAHRREVLALDHYVLSTRLRLGGDALLTHRIVPRNLGPDAVSIEVTDRKRGFPHAFTVSVAGLRRRSSAAFDLPPLLRDPYLDVVRQGRFYQELDAWMLGNDWDVWVALELGQPSSWATPSGLLRSTALDIAATAGSDREVANALYRFVRDEIRTTDPGVDERLLGDPHVAINLDLAQMERELDEEVDSPLAQRFRDAQQLPPAQSEVTRPTQLGPSRTPDAVLAQRAGTRLEKTVLLASLFAASHLEHRIAFVRDRSFGPYDDESTGRWQFTDALVVLFTPDLRPDLWYCPTRDDLPAGVLPAGLQNVAMLSVRDAFEDELAESWEQARVAAGARIELRVPAWLNRLRVADWARWSRTPGNPSDPCGGLEERLLWSAHDAPAQLQVRSVGESSFDPAGYVERRFPEARVVSALTFDAPAEADQRRSSAGATFEPSALPAAEDGAWKLPGPTIFGVGPLHAWSRDQAVFHVERTLDHAWRVDLPLPEGWKDIVPIADFVQQHDRLYYAAQARADEGRLVIERRLRLVAGTSPNAELVELLGNILLFENGWLVVRAR